MAVSEMSLCICTEVKALTVEIGMRYILHIIKCVNIFVCVWYLSEYDKIYKL